MQAITIAIGKAGIQFFAQQFLSGQILNLLKTLQAPTRNITVPSFKYSDLPGSTTTISSYSLELAQGQILNFTPSYSDEVTQGQSGGVALFTLNFPAGPFQAAYNWEETYHWDTEGVTNGPHPAPYHQSGDKNYSSDYTPEFSGMLVTVVVQFAYDTQSGAWQIIVQSTNGQSTVLDTKLPSHSVLRYQSGGCSGYHFDQTTLQAIEDINFGPPINALIEGVLKTIPGSGNLGNGILYDFSLGDGGIAFPNNDGIQMGVKGGASYNGTAFSAASSPSLAFPPPPADADSHHLCMYVSNYEVDALNWAFYKAGKLNTVVNADDLPDPNILKVKTYVSNCPELKPFSAFSMQAQITLNSAPVTSFQSVYELTKAVLDVLKTQLPADQYNYLSNLQGNNYTSVSDLESDMQEVGITPTYFPLIEAAAKVQAMVVTHDINFALNIQTFKPDEPNIVFNIQRTDILTNLSLGIGPNNAQTMQFQFNNLGWSASFVSSNIPNLNASALHNIWSYAGEAQYDGLLVKLGTSGVPVPIMQGFQFDFSNAELSIQDSYISVLANVSYQTS